jgi:universal stress protein A
MLRWLKVLCAVDFTEVSQATLEDAAGLARRLDAELALLHVREPPRVVGRALAVSPELDEQETIEIGRKLERWRQEAEALAGRPVRAMLTGGAPGVEIPRMARDGQFDVVVVGTHGRKGLPRALLGSVAEQVVRHAPCAVVVARQAPDED